MKGLVVRPVSAGDYVAVSVLEQGPSGCRYQAAVFIRQSMTLWPRSFLVAEDEGSVAGYLVGMILPDDPAEAWIMRLKVVQEKQRQGIGTAMMNRVQEILHHMGAGRILLSCSPENTGALSLYAGFGYRVIEYNAGYFGPGEDRLILSKNLTR